VSDNPQVSKETEDEMRARFFEQVLADLELKTENWQIIIAPLGDSIGYRVEMHITDGPETAFLAGASNASALTAGCSAVARGLTRIEEALAEDHEDAQTD
jgi:hypothetical protein